MGAKQSKRSVDITNSPSKTGEGEVIGEGEGRVVKIGDADVKSASTNGTVPHTENDIEIAEKDENAKDLTVEKSVEIKEKDVVEVKEVKENGVSDSEEPKTPDSDSTGDNLNESAVSEKSPESAPEGKEGEATPETKKQKEKKKKKWSFRSISFSKKDKSKPNKEAEKNGEVKEVAEENAEEVKSPSTESPKTEKPETPAEPVSVLNGEASKEEIAVSPTPEEVAPTEEPKKEEPKVEESIPEEPKVEELKIDDSKVEEVVEKSNISEPTESAPEEPNIVKSPAEETKEVRNEEIPPPLPSSNPPSSLTAFAESTKADILNTDTIDLLQVTTVVNPALEKEIGEPLFEEAKKVIENSPISDSVTVSSLKSEVEPNLNCAELPKSDPLLESVDSEKSIADLLVKSPEPQKSAAIDLTPKDNSVPMESETLVLQSQVYEPTSEISLQESEKSEPKAAELEQNLQPLVQEILSVVSTEPSESSDPVTIEEDVIPVPSTIELNLEPLARSEIDEHFEIKDLQSKTDLDVIQPQTDLNINNSDVPEPVEVKKTPENIALVSQENNIESEVTSQESLPSGFIQTPKSSVESNKIVIEPTAGPQLTPVELVIEDAKPQNINQPHSEQSLHYSEDSESIDLPPPQESEQEQTGFVDDNKSYSPPAPPAELPSPTDLPALVDPTDSLQDISTESLPSLPEPVSENLAEPMSLPPVDSVPEPIATDCLSPESIPITTDSIAIKSVPLATDSVPLANTDSVPLASDSIPVESDPLPPTECPLVLTNGNVNGLLSSGEVSPTKNGGSILGEAAPLKQIPQEVPSETAKEEGEKLAAATTEVAPVEE